MKRKMIALFMIAVFVIAAGCTEVVKVNETLPEAAVETADGDRPPQDGKPPQDDERPGPPQDGEIPSEAGSRYSIDQAISDNAQLTTIAFSGLAFLTGTEGADGFFPPGKVADFFGFQYMRDMDINGYGHNTTFLTKIASNILYVMNDEQIELLKGLAYEQEAIYEDFGFGRLSMIHAFRDHYENGADLDDEVIIDFSEELYAMDGELSYKRAEVLGEIIRSLTDEQKTYIDKMAFNDSSTWPDVEEDSVLDKRSMSHMEHVAVMTYASELFSWYAGSIDADVYFCPERHGTYFGGFYMKDYPAMGNPDYFISTSITGDSGRTFLEILTVEQREKITNIIDEQKASLERIVAIRTEVSELLRTFMTEDETDQARIMALLEEYGTLEGEMSLLYAKRFAEVGHSLTEDQKEALMELRNQYVFPDGAYLYSQPIDMPSEFIEGLTH